MNVSVIVPCHNAERYLAETLESVLAQTRRPDEIIVVDDASSDRSVETAGQFAPDIRVVRGRAGGASAARNMGYPLANGDAIMFLDADDVLGRDAILGLTESLAEHPHAIAICPWYRLEHRNGTWVRRPPSWPSGSTGHDRLSAWLMGRYYPPCAVLWSRPAYERTGGWNEAVPVNNDGDIMMRAMILGVALVEAHRGEAYYRRVPASEESVSGRQRSRAGRASQLSVIRNVAEALSERRHLEPYRRPLAQAFNKIARECGDDFPDLAHQARVCARRYGEPLYRRVARHGIGRFRHVVQRAFGVS